MHSKKYSCTGFPIKLKGVDSSSNNTPELTILYEISSRIEVNMINRETNCAKTVSKTKSNLFQNCVLSLKVTEGYVTYKTQRG